MHSVFKTSPGQWGELLPLVEFILWNTPGKTGLAPRDLVMAWSLASPLEREILPLDVPEAEAVSDIAVTQFGKFQQVRDVYLQHKANEGRRRMELANRQRSQRSLQKGDRVLYKDPKMVKSVAGHAPGRRLESG